MKIASPTKETFGADYSRDSSPEDYALRNGQVLHGLGSKKAKRKQLKSDIKLEVTQLRNTINQFEQERQILQDDAYLNMLKDQNKENSSEKEDRI